MAIKFEKIKEGMTLYDVHKRKMGNTTVSSVGVWPVQIIELKDNGAIVSWNYNTPQHWPRSRLEGLRAKEPELVRNALGQMRLKRRGEQ